MAEETLSAQDELDLSKDSAVEVVTERFRITEAELEEKESPKGRGEQATIVFESDSYPYPITMRFFLTYENKDASESKDPSTFAEPGKWVKRSRGQVKNIVKAAGRDPARTRAAFDSTSDNYLVGQEVTATTRDNGDGFAALSRFKKVAE